MNQSQMDASIKEIHAVYCTATADLTYDISGKTFGKLTAIGLLPERRQGQRYWVCRCECGSEHIATYYRLTNGMCIQCNSCRIKAQTKHGHAKKTGHSPTWMSWSSMKQRCRNPKATHFKRYGGRGIDYCERWESFDAFLSDMGERPNGTTLERKDNDLGYFPENCKWASRKEQSSNMWNNRYTHVDGRRVNLLEASRITGVNWSSLLYQLSTQGLVIKNGHFMVPEWTAITPKTHRK